jgi:RNA polymerase primary sigma factor
MNNTRKRKEVNDNLTIYLKEINRIPVFTREEEETTARLAAAGNKAAREKLINANLRFVITVAKKYQGLGLSLEDLISEGNVGLINAADRFNVEKGYHFISYAVWWIRQAIISALYEKSRMIRLPVNCAADLIKIDKAGKMIEKQSSSEDEINEIAELLNMDKKHIKEIVNISKEILSLDNRPNNQVQPLLELIEDKQYMSPEKHTELICMKDDIDSMLDSLTKDEAEIIRCHYGLGRKEMSLNEIGACYNLSKERIRQIEEKAIARLRNPKRADQLKSYVA